MEMTDRFKFRVWDKHRNTYSAVAAIPCGNLALSDAGGLFWIESHCDCSELDAENYIVEQCTGVKDENRKLVYEGDLLRHSIDGYVQSELFVVEDLRSFFFFLDQEDPYYAVDWIEVVGNIHEDENKLVREANNDKQS